jgi:hypothetical protein
LAKLRKAPVGFSHRMGELSFRSTLFREFGDGWGLINSYPLNSSFFKTEQN